MQKYHLHNRPNRELKQESDMINILKNGKFAVISMCRDNEPYIVILSILPLELRIVKECIDLCLLNHSTLCRMLKNISCDYQA